MTRSDIPRMNDRFRHLVAGCILSFAMVGCCSNDCCSSGDFDQVLVNLDNAQAFVGDHSVMIWVGDHAVVTGTAWHSPNDFCGGDVDRYTSKTKPSAFTFTSSDTTVATISETGALTARAIGLTAIKATTGGIVGVMHVVVVPPIASVRIVVTPSAPRAGDTITFHAQAFDAAGVALDDNTVQLTLGGGAYLIPFTPVTIRTVGSSGQTLVASATALHDGVPPATPKVTATVTVTVGPPPS